jgi:hypothetical protein
MTTFYCLRFSAPQYGGAGPCIYIPQEQGGSVMPPRTGLPFRLILPLAGLRWRYWNSPLHGVTDSKSKWNQSHFTNGGLPPTSSSWSQVPWDSCLGGPSCLQDISSARTTQKTQLLYCYRGAFTAPLHCKDRDADQIENTVLLLRACVLRTLPSSGSCLQSLLSNGSMRHNINTLCGARCKFCKF